MSPRVVVVGASLGGLRALETLLSALPKDFPAAVAVVQHRLASADESLVTLLARHSTLAVSEAEDKDPLQPGHVLVAPPDYHLLIDEEGVALSTEAPVNHSRPSIDVLFESAAHALGPRVVGVVLTGSTRDGALGAAAIKARGGIVIVESPATAEASVMPEAARPVADRVLDLDEIAECLVDLCTPRRVPKDRGTSQPPASQG